MAEADPFDDAGGACGAAGAVKDAEGVTAMPEEDLVGKGVAFGASHEGCFTWDSAGFELASRELGFEVPAKCEPLEKLVDGCLSGCATDEVLLDEAPNRSLKLELKGGAGC